MGKKYSINSAGYIVAERDIYSFGGFIPKGSVGGKVASEKQLSQDGECWLAGGDISGRPDIVIKDNAYVGNFVGATGMHTDGVTEFSGNTLIPGKIIVRNPIADPVNNFYAKDSFIGISMDVLCGPEANTTAFPFEQGLYSVKSAKGTLFANMVATPTPVNSCRGIAALRLGKDAKIYVPAGLRCQALWGYYNAAGQEAYSGRYTEYAPGLHTISDPVYGIARLHFWKDNGAAMTPSNLLATGAKILGHISSSVNVDIRPESASGSYVMDKSSFLVNTDNFGLNTTQLRFLAGSMYDTTMYTKVDRQGYKLYGTFRNVERLEYTKYLGDSHRTAATRDTYISAYDCPLLRVDETTYNTSLTAKGSLVLRRCIVPKAVFTSNIFNGDVYEDIDFSYAQEHLGKAFIGNTLASSHRQGLYAASFNNRIVGFVSRPENAADGAYIGPDAKDDPLDGSVIEQGTYDNTLIGQYYEDTKADFSDRVRTRVPFSTEGAYLPTMPSGFKIAVACYLDENFILTEAKTDPTSVPPDYPYFVLAFGKSDNSAITPKDFAALNLYIRSYDYSSVPTVSGNGLVGEGCNVRGDVKVIGQPYVNRILDVNLWERGTTGAQAPTWEEAKGTQVLPHRVRLVDTIRVRPGDTVTCKDAYYVECNAFDGNGRFLSRSAWVKSYKVPENASFLGLVLRLVSDGYMDESDIQTAEVRYVTEFKTENYITNELSRVSPSDVLLGPDYWENKVVNNVQASDGKPYDTIKVSDDKALILKKPINILNSTLTTYIAKGFIRGNYRFDANTKFYYSSASPVTSALMSLVVQREPSGVLQPSDIADAQLRIKYVPTPRIVKPYGSTGITIQKTRVRLYDNAVLSLQLASGQDVVLKDNAIMGNTPGACVCGNGHDDAIIKKP
jgi:hypothetical protein